MISKRIKQFCKEYWNIENYEKAINDDAQVWDCHHRDEILEDGTKVSRKELIRKGLYYDVPADKLIFLTKEEHLSLHHKGKIYTKATTDKMCNSHQDYSGNNNPFYGRSHSIETRQKIAETVSKMSKGAVGRNKLFKWLDVDGNIHLMASGHAHRWHPDWTKIDEN